jgi:hypothetical protein
MPKGVALPSIQHAWPFKAARTARLLASLSSATQFGRVLHCYLGSPALSMMAALLRFLTTRNPLENEHRCAGRRPQIIESAGEPLFGFSRTFDEVRPPQSPGCQEFLGKRGPLC